MYVLHSVCLSHLSWTIHRVWIASLQGAWLHIVTNECIALQFAKQSTMLTYPAFKTFSLLNGFHTSGLFLCHRAQHHNPCFTLCNGIEWCFVGAGTVPKYPLHYWKHFFTGPATRRKGMLVTMAIAGSVVVAIAASQHQLASQLYRMAL